MRSPTSFFVKTNKQYSLVSPPSTPPSSENAKRPRPRLPPPPEPPTPSLIEEKSSILRHPNSWYTQNNKTNPHTTGNPVTRTSKNGRIHPQLALQSYLSLLLSILLIHLRHSSHSTLISSLRRQHLQFPIDNYNNTTLPRFHIFAAPKPFHGIDRTHQLRAIESWLSLEPKPKITLLGNSPGTYHISKSYKLVHNPNIDITFKGIPLVSSIFNAINVSCNSLNNSNTICIFLNCDLILFDDFTLAIRKLYTHNNWIAISSRWDIKSIDNFIKVQGYHQSFKNFDLNNRLNAVNYIRDNGSLRTFGGIDLWAWPSNIFPFLNISIPPFVLGRGRYDNWITHFLLNHNSFDVVDISEAVTVTHVSHDHHLIIHDDGDDDNISSKQYNGGDVEFWASVNTKKTFESVVNAYLSVTASSPHVVDFLPQMGTTLHAPFKLTSCVEDIPLCLFRRKRPHSCRCEQSPFVMSTLTDPFVPMNSSSIICGLLPSSTSTLEEERIKYNHQLSGYTSNHKATFGLPLTLTDIMKNGSEEIMILITADISDKLLLMETVCSIRKSGIFNNVIIAAFDDDMYKFCIINGLAVYLVDYDDSAFGDHRNFKQLASLQSIYEILIDKNVNILFIKPGIIFNQSPWIYLNNGLFNTYKTDIAFIPELFISNVNNNFTTFGQPEQEQEVGASIAMLFVKHSKGSISLLKNVMAEIELSSGRVGEILWGIACGNSLFENKDQEKKKSGMRNIECRHQSIMETENGNGKRKEKDALNTNFIANVHLFDVEKFKSLAPPKHKWTVKKIRQCVGPNCFWTEVHDHDDQLDDNLTTGIGNTIAWLPYGFEGRDESNDNIMKAIHHRKLSRYNHDGNYCTWS